jgi:hypothetical protein
MAGREIDLLGDPLATDKERQLRKQRLIKGPEEFRDIRSNRAAVARWPAARTTLRQGARIVHESGQQE